MTDGNTKPFLIYQSSKLEGIEENKTNHIEDKPNEKLISFDLFRRSFGTKL